MTSRAEALSHLHFAVCACPGISISALPQLTRICPQRLPDLLGTLVADGLICLRGGSGVWPVEVCGG